MEEGGVGVTSSSLFPHEPAWSKVKTEGRIGEKARGRVVKSSFEGSVMGTVVILIAQLTWRK